MTLLRLARLKPGIALLLLLTGCASTPQTRQLLAQTPENLRRTVNLETVAFFPQQAYQCGPAALATMLDYQGIHTQPEDLTDQVYIPALKGSLQLEMIASARSYGLLSYKLTPHMLTLITEINAGHPVLVFQNLAYHWWPQWHYAVAVGYDLDKEDIILRSGPFREHRIALTTFERTWQRTDYWGYVILKPGLIPATATPLPYIDAVISLEKTGSVIQALSAFRSAAQTWPDQPTVLMALSNSEYSSGQLTSANTVLRRLIARHPQHANAWNNLAFILAEQNCYATAHKAIDCARQLAPDDPNIQHSYKELNPLPVSDMGDCLPIQCPEN